MFYTYVEMINSKIFHRYIDNKGVSRSEVVKDTPLELFVQGKRGPDSSISLMGEPLAKIEFTNVADTMEFLKNYQKQQKIYGQTSLAHQFISQRYPEEVQFNFNQIPIMGIDIETAYDETGFPSPEKANQEILSVTLKKFGTGNPFMVFGTKSCSKVDGFTYVQCHDEEDLFEKFQKYWREINPAIVTGWNVAGFDIPYIINRSNKIMGESFTRKFSCFSNELTNCVSVRDDFKGNPIYTIVGLSVVDYIDIYKKYSGTTLESYRLDVVAQHELGTGKVDYSEYNGLMGLYEKNYDLFLYYNMTDVKLIEEFENKLNYLFLAVTVAYLGKIKYQEIFSQVKFWDIHIYNALKDKGIQVSPQGHTSKDEIVGAYVKLPIPKLYQWIVTLDLTSLYPSIIMSFNMSPETLARSAIHTIDSIEKYISMEMDNNDAITQNCSVLTNGAMFSNAKHGIFPELVEEMFASRKAFKKRAISAANELERLKDSNADVSELDAKKSEVATFDARQNAYKIVLNSLYGATANEHFRYNSRDIAEGITMTGQHIIRFISNRLNTYLNQLLKTTDVDYIIFNDTDSAGLNLQYLIEKTFPDQSNREKIVNFLDKFVKTYIDPFLEAEFVSFAKYMNIYKNMLSMKREVIADRGIWRGKKHYILQVWDKEGIRYQTPKLKMMGIEVAKSSTPKIVRKSLEQGIDILLNKDEKTLHNFVTTFKKAFNTAPIEDIAFPRGVSDMDKWIDADGSMKIRVPIHTRGCIIYNKLLKEKKLIGSEPAIKNGDKVKFIYLKPQNPTQSNVIAFLDHLPTEFGLDAYVDKEIQFGKTFLEPLRSLATIVGWTTEKTSTLDSFFS